VVTAAALSPAPRQPANLFGDHRGLRQPATSRRSKCHHFQRRSLRAPRITVRIHRRPHASVTSRRALLRRVVAAILRGAQYRPLNRFPARRRCLPWYAVARWSGAGVVVPGPLTQAVAFALDDLLSSARWSRRSTSVDACRIGKTWATVRLLVVSNDLICSRTDARITSKSGVRVPFVSQCRFDPRRCNNRIALLHVGAETPGPRHRVTSPARSAADHLRFAPGPGDRRGSARRRRGS
jgi:hypothetical protein